MGVHNKELNVKWQQSEMLIIIWILDGLKF
jgi:hypothetical protein